MYFDHLPHHLSPSHCFPPKFTVESVIESEVFRFSVMLVDLFASPLYSADYYFIYFNDSR
jgi:hypothetical protein